MTDEFRKLEREAGVWHDRYIESFEIIMTNYECEHPPPVAQRLRTRHLRSGLGFSIAAGRFEVADLTSRLSQLGSPPRCDAQGTKPDRS